MKRLLASNLWPMLTSESGNARLARFQARIEPALDALFEALLFYDELIIPTQDYLILPALQATLGEKTLLELLDTNTVRFSRIKGAIAVGSPGLLLFTLKRSDGQTYPFGADLDWTIRWASFEFTKATDSASLMRLVLAASSEVDAKDLLAAISSEVALDFSSIGNFPKLFDAGTFYPTALRHDQIHMYGGPDHPSGVPGLDEYLRVAQLNSELELSKRNDCSDIATGSHLDALLRTKIRRERRDSIGERVLEIANVPDLGPLVRRGRLEISALMKLRESRDGVAFRAWIHDNLTTANPVEIAKAYTELVRGTDAIDGTAGRIIRGIMWTVAAIPAGLVAGGVGGVALGAATGLAGSLLDSFLVSKLRLRSSPVVFLDRLRSVAEKSTPK